jgi:hypothetical protein
MQPFKNTNFFLTSALDGGANTDKEEEKKGLFTFRGTEVSNYGKFGWKF